MTFNPIDFLVRNSTAAMAVAVLVGLAWPAAATALSPFIQTAVLIMLAVSFMRVDTRALRLSLSHPAPAVVGVIVLHLIGPVVAILVAQTLAHDPGTREGIILNGLAPTMMASPALALMLDLDFSLALVVTVVSTLIFPLSFAAAISLGFVASVPGGLATIFPRVLLMVGGPLALAIIGRRLLGPEGLIRYRQKIDAAMVVLLLFFAVALMDGANIIFRTAPERVLPLLVAACLFNPLAQFLTATCFWRWGRNRALTLGLLVGNRNLGLVLGILAGLSGADFYAYVAFAQFPIYILPAASKALYRRLLAT